MKQPRTLPDGRMNPKAASEYLGLSEKTLAIKRCDGTGPAFVKRGRVFYFRADLDEWLKAGRSRSTAESRGKRNTSASSTVD